tara:strand:+ start:177 stop:389 length:213 start_codon:yes stop_codon:yes gene_type:complete
MIGRGRDRLRCWKANTLKRHNGKKETFPAAFVDRQFQAMLTSAPPLASWHSATAIVCCGLHAAAATVNQL